MARDTVTGLKLKVLELELAGKSQVEIAEITGKARATVQRWMSQPAYREHRDKLIEAIDRATVVKARRLREQALAVGTMAVQRGAQALQSGPVDAATASQIGRLAHEWYRTTAAQTGVEEGSRLTVQPTQLTEDDLTQLTDAELIAIEQGDG